MDESDGLALDSVLEEQEASSPRSVRREFSRAVPDPEAASREASENIEAFWAESAGRDLKWFWSWERVLDWNPPFAD